jgi:CheY-like chemotaxis protein
MEAVGKLAGGVAHDFNNLLTAIIGFSSLASDELPIGSPVQDSLAQIRKSAEQAAALTRQLLAFGRRQILQPEVLDVGEVVAHVLPMLRRLIGEDITVTTDLQPVPTIRADRTQVQQVLLNLAVNARDAMPLGGVLTIRTARTQVDARDNGGPDLAPGQYVVLEVTDTGHGVDSTMTDRIFEPFFTTKAFGQGTGLGLSTVYGIAKQSGGDVQVSSSPGRGATFRVLLPAAPSAALRLTPEPQPVTPVPQAGAGTILLVEDDDAVRDFVSEVLRASGWVVVAVSTPAHALASAARQSLSIDLLVTDVVMPGMNGGELADKLVAMRPDLRVLFITGYDDEDVAMRGLIEPGRECLSKPFTPSQLRARVEMLVSRAG